MKKLILFFCLAMAAFCVNGQTIKMKIASVTPTDGETVIAFETSDTLLISSGSGGGSSSGIPRFEDIKIKKLRDQSTNELFKRSISGTVLSDATFEFYDAANVLYYKIVIREVRIAHMSYLSPECSNCSNLYHQVWFDYQRIETTDVAVGTTIRYNLATRAFY